LRGLLEPVFDEEVQVVPLIKNPAAHVRVEGHEAPHLTVLLGNQFLIERGDLDVEIECREVEIGGKALRGVSLPVPFDIEGGGLVRPIDLIEIEKPGELTLAVVGELDALVGKWISGRYSPAVGPLSYDQPSSASIRLSPRSVP
jgi:hypothetical protein